MSKTKKKKEPVKYEDVPAKVRRKIERSQNRHFEAYEPALTVVGCRASHGVKSVIPPTKKINRPIQVMSELEEAVAYLALYDDRVIDIREQYPVGDPATMINLAREMHIPPVHGYEKAIEHIMTTDFRFTVRVNGEEFDVVRTVKSKKEIDPNNPKTARTRQKLALEQEYYRREGIDWAVLTEDDIDKKKAKELKIRRVLDSLKSVEGEAA